MANDAVMQDAWPGECQRRVRFENAEGRFIHVIIEEEEHSGDGLFEDERARVTVPYDLLTLALGAVRSSKTRYAGGEA